MDVCHVGRVAIMRLIGRITLGETINAFRDQLYPLIDESHEVILNLEHVNYLDSHAIGTIFSAYKSAKGKGRRLRIVRPESKRTQDILRITATESVIEIFDDESQAIASLSPCSP